MPIFVIKDKYGVAVVNADSAEEALGLLKEKEGEEDFIAYRKKVEDVVPFSTEKGVAVYSYHG